MKKQTMKLQYALLLIPFFVLLSQNTLAANPAHGKDLHDANCQSCHASLMGGDPDKIYTRSNRRVSSINGLKNQVTRCKTSVGVAWPDDQVQDVVEYLNTRFYKM
ncbi:MAG: cytochrome c [gamma proteobacterium symbiont of Lucinoma myriamae]|nr:cytochrome c [gamma proteobacterium symbiont of Lucinoma myriamae]MCU7817419.1 cytochrome c [gamma proteobacterium symbiont of Lucinoma myriamae]MCU7832455.1 cytochrome c [gamma proteobacterium symbiont of Lucinoma myriamae]